MEGSLQGHPRLRMLSASLEGSYWLTRAVFLRGLGSIYAVGFLGLWQQGDALLGSRGLLPAAAYLQRVESGDGDRVAAFLQLPTLFWLDSSDAALHGLAGVGLAMALVVVAGFANQVLLAALWFLYMSFVHVGQLFYGYGWEILLLETGFLAIFLCPVLDGRPLPWHLPTPTLVVWLLRWLLFRLMFGAGLIKLRGDACWLDLTCMQYHYETQPLPNPLSWYLHHLPASFHACEVLFNHFVELVVPWFLFGPRRLRHVGGVFLVAFQCLLILSGNLSWLNWLTLTLCISAFDDAALGFLVSDRLRARIRYLAGNTPTPMARWITTLGLTAVVAWLSLGPVTNMAGSEQIMNGSFDRLHLVNTYGAFGTIGRERHEVILEGTADRELGAATRWREYEFVCKPGDVMRRPCVVGPYQYRVDWQIWFAAMQDPRANPWLVHLLSKLLRNDPGALGLLANDPFPGTPPKFVRAELYEYRFTPPSDASGGWWERRRIGEYLPPLSADNPGLRRFLDANGWAD